MEHFANISALLLLDNSQKKISLDIGQIPLNGQIKLYQSLVKMFLLTETGLFYTIWMPQFWAL